MKIATEQSSSIQDVIGSAIMKILPRTEELNYYILEVRYLGIGKFIQNTKVYTVFNFKFNDYHMKKSKMI